MDRRQRSCPILHRGTPPSLSAEPSHPFLWASPARGVNSWEGIQVSAHLLGSCGPVRRKPFISCGLGHRIQVWNRILRGLEQPVRTCSCMDADKDRGQVPAAQMRLDAAPMQDRIIVLDAADLGARRYGACRVSRPSGYLGKQKSRAAEKQSFGQGSRRPFWHGACSRRNSTLRLLIY